MSRSGKGAIEAMNARLRAEMARGWPSSPEGKWTDETRGYVDLRSIPVPAEAVAEESKQGRKAERSEEFLRTGEVPG